jgi:hypothetical protein
MTEKEAGVAIEKIDNAEKLIASVDKKIDKMFEKYDKLKESNIRHDEKIALLWKVFLVTPAVYIISTILNKVFATMNP